MIRVIILVLALAVVASAVCCEADVSDGAATVTENCPDPPPFDPTVDAGTVWIDNQTPHLCDVWINGWLVASGVPPVTVGGLVQVRNGVDWWFMPGNYHADIIVDPGGPDERGLSYDFEVFAGVNGPPLVVPDT